jgi:hypothetical protein
LLGDFDDIELVVYDVVQSELDRPEERRPAVAGQKSGRSSGPLVQGMLMTRATGFTSFTRQGLGSMTIDDADDMLSG